METLRLPDRGSTGPSLRGALFVFRQPLILWTGLAATLAIGAALAKTSVDAGRATPESLIILVLIAPLCGFGFAVLLALPVFVGRGLLTAKPAPQGDARVLGQDGANHFLGDEGRGGALCYGEDALYFVPHRFNVQLDALTVAYREITRVGYAHVVTSTGMHMAWALEVEVGGRVETFVVEKGAEVAERVERLRQMRREDRASIFD